MMENEPTNFSQSPYRRPISRLPLHWLQVFSIAIISAILGSVFTLSFGKFFSEDKKNQVDAIATAQSSSSLPLNSVLPQVISPATLPQKLTSKKEITTTILPEKEPLVKQNSTQAKTPLQTGLKTLNSAKTVEEKPLKISRNKSPAPHLFSVKAFPNLNAQSSHKEKQIVKKMPNFSPRNSNFYLFSKSVKQTNSESNLNSNSNNNRNEVKLSLNDVVFLVIENNRDLKNAYLDRLISRQNLAVAEDKFVPNFTPRVSLDVAENETNSQTINNQEFNLGANFNVKIPTGADIRLEWSGLRSSRTENGINLLNPLNQNRINQDFQLTFNQPLLRNFGTNVNRASVNIARIESQTNILQLKNTLIETITSAIQAYLSLVQAQEQVKIQELSLASSKRQLEVTQALIEAGRLARIELVQVETDIASREVNLLEAQSSLDSARLNLLQILDIEGNLQIVAAEVSETVTGNISLDYEQLLQQALANDPEYLQAIYAVEIEQLNLLLAKNDQRWDLDLEVSYGIDADNLAENSNDLRAGLNFTREFGNLELEQAVERGQINLEKSENNLQEVRENLAINLQDRIREVEVSARQVELARKFRELAEEKLQNEREKLRLGVPGTRLIDIINFEDELVRAKNAELNAKIDYLNALTNLRQTVGITLEVWEIEIKEN
ncbi:MAG: TolC family protein [Oscillatoria sp. PMC 1068.18]|nr:TolC family protein [Oscillatoria sp. PMC 1076.18]MEC4988381.1 TolC family protein [Oscillatoria sp. PMC 1068.18]